MTAEMSAAMPICPAPSHRDSTENAISGRNAMMSGSGFITSDARGGGHPKHQPFS